MGNVMRLCSLTPSLLMTSRRPNESHACPLELQNSQLLLGNLHRLTEHVIHQASGGRQQTAYKTYQNIQQIATSSKMLAVLTSRLDTHMLNSKTKDERPCTLASRQQSWMTKLQGHDGTDAREVEHASAMKLGGKGSRRRVAHSAIGQEAAHARSEHPAAGSCSKSSCHVHDSRACKVNHTRAHQEVRLQR